MSLCNLYLKIRNKKSETNALVWLCDQFGKLVIAATHLILFLIALASKSAALVAFLFS